MKDVLNYAKIIRELCRKKHRRNPKVPIHVMDKLSNSKLVKITHVKYDDPINPDVTIQIIHIYIPNILVDLEATVNIMTTKTFL